MVTHLFTHVQFLGWINQVGPTNRPGLPWLQGGPNPCSLHRLLGHLQGLITSYFLRVEYILSVYLIYIYNYIYIFDVYSEILSHISHTNWHFIWHPTWHTLRHCDILSDIYFDILCDILSDIYIYIPEGPSPMEKRWGGVGWGMLPSCSCYVDATLMGGVGWGGACYRHVHVTLMLRWWEGWGGVGHVTVMFMLRWCYVDGRGGVGWGMLPS